MLTPTLTSLVIVDKHPTNGDNYYRLSSLFSSNKLAWILIRSASNQYLQTRSNSSAKPDPTQFRPLQTWFRSNPIQSFSADSTRFHNSEPSCKLQLQPTDPLLQTQSDFSAAQTHSKLVFQPFSVIGSQIRAIYEVLDL